MSFPDPASRCTASSASSTSSGGWTNGCKGKRARRTSSRRLPMRTPIAAALALALATMTTVTAGSAQQKPTHADADRLVQGTTAAKRLESAPGQAGYKAGYAEGAGPAE